jgi:hypothetical protein
MAPIISKYSNQYGNDIISDSRKRQLLTLSIKIIFLEFILQRFCLKANKQDWEDVRIFIEERQSVATVIQSLCTLNVDES